MTSPFAEACEAELMKLSGVMPLIEDVGRELKALRLAKPMAQLMPHKPEGGKAFSYSLKLRPDAPKVEKFFHYGAAPVLLAANTYGDAKAIQDAANVPEEELTAAGLSPAESAVLKRQIHGQAIGRAVGDAAAWAMYPATFRHPAMHYGASVGSAFLLPALGAAAGKRLY